MSKPSQPLGAKVLFVVTGLAAAAVLLGSGSTFPPASEWGWWLAVLPVVVLYRYPVSVTRGSKSIEIGFESVVIIFLAFAVPDHALALWTGGWVLTQIKPPTLKRGRTTPPWITFYNFAMSVLSGAATVVVVTKWMPHSLEPGPWALAAVALGAAAYFLVDYILTAIAMPLLGRGTLREAWQYDHLGITLACSGCVAALGYLGAVVVRADYWALPLLLVPITTFIVASRGYVGASRERARVSALFAVASRLHHAQTAAEATAIVLDQGRRALRVEELSLVAVPAEGVPRASVLTSSNEHWLVPTPRLSSETFTADDQQTLDLLASLASDSLRRVALHDDLETLATHDALTGLPNRGSLHEVLARELGPVASRARPAVPTALLFCDLDGFKRVNDQHGHEAGDQLLKVVAERLRGCVREGDLVARLGGDEFVLLLPRTARAEALSIAERVLASVQQPILLTSGATQVGVSIGVALSEPTSSADELLNRADAAMYEAKAQGKGRVSLSAPDRTADLTAG